MPKDTLYTSKTPDAQGRYSYTATEDSTWSHLFKRQMANLQGKADQSFFDGVEKLGLNDDKVPQINNLTQRLNVLSGAGAYGVPAIIPPKQFFTLLSQRQFPVATFLRRPEHIDYIEEPDLFHEVFGHLPMLTDPTFADVIERFGKLALTMPKGCNWHMFRLFWFTVEFGMINTADGLRAIGAGIVSSPAETENAFSGTAQMRPFDLIEVLRTTYRIDIVQPLYFVIDGPKQLLAALTEDLASAVAKAQDLGDYAPLYAPLEG